MFARQMRTGSLLLLAGSLLSLSGCSLAFVNGPPDFIPADQPAPPGSCSIERVLPVLDAVGAGASLITALTNSDGDVVRFSAVLSAGLGFSSYTGFRRVESCRERMFMGPARALPDTTGVGLFHVTTPLLAEPLLPDLVFTRVFPNRGLTGSGIWPKRN